MRNEFHAYVRERYTGTIYWNGIYDNYREALYNVKIQKDVKEEVEDIECFWEIYKNGREFSCSYDFPEKGE